MNSDIANLRREYGVLGLDENEVAASPLVQFNTWLTVALQYETDATAMTLATVDAQGCPDARTILLKGMDEHHLLFYTNYDSPKAQQILNNPKAALVFYWPHLARQVRFRGQVQPLSARESVIYFASRPFASQISAVASPQSRVISSRKWLEEAHQNVLTENAHQKINRPPNWGGYQFLPTEVEFFQGRDNRLHDRIHYMQDGSDWLIRRLAP